MENHFNSNRTLKVEVTFLIKFHHRILGKNVCLFVNLSFNYDSRIPSKSTSNFIIVALFANEMFSKRITRLENDTRFRNQVINFQFDIELGNEIYRKYLANTFEGPMEDFEQHMIFLKPLQRNTNIAELFSA